MNTYAPDTWSILLFDSPTYGKIHKVFGGWYGGFTQGDSWKLSSGMKDLVDEGDFYSSLQESGSIYQLYKNSEKLSVYQLGILAGWELQLKEQGVTIKVVSPEEYIEFIKGEMK